MPGRLRMCVVIVVPTFTEGQHCDPKTVLGSIAGGEALRSPHVSGRVDEPGEVKTNYSPEKDSPHDKLPATQHKQKHPQSAEGDPVPVADPSMELIFAKVGDIRQKLGGAAVHRLARHDPAHVRPETAIAGRVWVAFLVRVLVMESMHSNPEDRSALKSQSPANCENVFHPLRSFVAAMCEKPMVAHADTEASRDPPQNERQCESLPTKQE